MVKFLFKRNKNYSRFNIIKQLTNDIKINNDVYILLPFSKNQFFKHFFKRDKIINDFFISNYDTYVYDRKKITNKNPRAWWKYFQDWFNFKFSKYLLSDTKTHFEYWESLFGKYKGEHMVLPVLADKTIYYPNKEVLNNKKTKILFFGSFIPLHGIDIILNAFKILEEKGINFEANIIGKGQTYDEMKLLYESLSLKQVQMNGEFIEERQLADEIRKHDLILGVFGESKKSKSVIPNKLYQAFACKKTILTMRSNAIYEFFNDEDLFMCENTAKDLSKNIEYCIKNKDVLDRISLNGYTKFLKLYDDTKNKFEKFINQVGKDT